MPKKGFLFDEAPKTTVTSPPTHKAVARDPDGRFKKHGNRREEQAGTATELEEGGESDVFGNESDDEVTVVPLPGPPKAREEQVGKPARRDARDLEVDEEGRASKTGAARSTGIGMSKRVAAGRPGSGETRDESFLPPLPLDGRLTLTPSSRDSDRTVVSIGSIGGSTGRQAVAQAAQRKQANLELLNARCSPLVRGRDLWRQIQFDKPFDGSGAENFDAFLERFEERADVAKWTEADRIAQLMSCLTGPARAFYNGLLESGQILRLSFMSLAEELRKAFPTASLNSHRALMAFTMMRQGKRESVNAYAFRFARAAKLAKVTEEDVLAKAWCQTVRKQFRQALMVAQISARGPVAWQDLVTQAVDMEAVLGSDSEGDEGAAAGWRDDKKRAWSDEMVEQDDVRPAKARYPGPRAQVNKISALGDDALVGRSSFAGLDAMIAEEDVEACVRRIIDAKFAQQTPAQVMSTLPPAQMVQPQFQQKPFDAAGGQPGGRAGGAPGACYNCGEPGHVSRDCSKRRDQRDGPDGRRPPADPRVCHQCGAAGHIARFCTSGRNPISPRPRGVDADGRGGWRDDSRGDRFRQGSVPGRSFQGGWQSGQRYGPPGRDRDQGGGRFVSGGNAIPVAGPSRMEMAMAEMMKKVDALASAASPGTGGAVRGGPAAAQQGN